MNSNNRANFDLNIANYKMEELEQLLELPSNYDESIIEMKETKLRQNIMNNKSIPNDVKNNTVNFITEVKKTLIVNVQTQRNSGLSSNVNSLAKTYQNVYNLDKNLALVLIFNSISSFILDCDIFLSYISNDTIDINCIGPTAPTLDVRL